MMYNYPFFSFPHFRRYPGYYPAQSNYIRRPIRSSYQIKGNINNQIGTQTNSHTNSEKLRSSSRERNAQNKLNNTRVKNQYSKQNYLAQKEHKKEETSSKRSPSGFSFLNNLFNQEDRGEEEEFFDLFGLKLYNDDLLLIGLIFFLYNENVKDQYLFFSLILLLLS